MSQEALVAIFAILMLPGLLGVVLPVLPGLPYMFVVALVFGFIDRFEHLRPWELGVLFVIALFSILIDYASGLLGARYGGAGRRAAVAGLIGLIIGLIVFPPFGGLIGLFIGVLVVELLRHQDSPRAVRAATGSVIGAVVGTVAALIMGVLFILLFVVFALR